MLEYATQIFIWIGIFAILAGSLNLILGYAGFFHVAHAAFFGTGAYLGARLVLLMGLPFPLDLVVGFVGAALLAVALGPALARLSGEQVIVGTLALQLVAQSVFVNWQWATGGSNGVFGIPRPTIGGIALTSLPAFGALVVLVTLLVFVLLAWLERLPYALALRALRDDPGLAGSFGKDVRRRRAEAFVVGSGLAGLAGALYGRFVGYIDPSGFTVEVSITTLTILVVGGMGNAWGALLGAALLETVPQILRFLPATTNAVPNLQLIFYGVVLLLVARLRPQGLLPERRTVGESQTQPRAASAPKTAGDLPPFDRGMMATPPTNTSLQIRGVTRRFGGVAACNDLSLIIPAGQVSAVIGPNGAGKTTLFNVLTGLVRPDAGSAIYAGAELIGRAPHQIARLGISRSFQNLRVFPSLTAVENVVVAIQEDRHESLLFALRHPRLVIRLRNLAAASAMQALDGLGLRDVAHRRMSDLSYAQQKLLVVAAISARSTPLILLDELAAGLDHESIDTFARLVRQLAANGHTVCLVEHNLDFVWQTADVVFVLDQGALIARGAPAEIQKDTRVAEIYFGGLAPVVGTPDVAVAGSAILELRDISAGYVRGRPVLRQVNLSFRAGELVVVMGHNGAGKTTLLNAIAGTMPFAEGEVRYRGETLRGNPEQRVQRGIAYSAAGQAVFHTLTVAENLDVAMALSGCDRATGQERLVQVRRLFPMLAERHRQLAGTLSGGQQRMLSVGMALMQGPRLLLLDEPSLGLSPRMVEQLYGVLVEIRTAAKLAIVVVEQSIVPGLRAADALHILRMGSVVFSGSGEVLTDTERLWSLL